MLLLLRLELAHRGRGVVTRPGGRVRCTCVREGRRRSIRVRLVRQARRRCLLLGMLLGSRKRVRMLGMPCRRVLILRTQPKSIDLVITVRENALGVPVHAREAMHA